MHPTACIAVQENAAPWPAIQEHNLRPGARYPMARCPEARSPSKSTPPHGLPSAHDQSSGLKSRRRNRLSSYWLSLMPLAIPSRPPIFCL